MRNLHTLILVLASLVASPAMAAETKIDITSPEDGSMVRAGMQNQVAYQFTLSGEADHAHLYVDGKMAGLLREAKGSATFDALAPGMHQICARMVNKNHTPVGVERCIRVTAE